MRPKTRKILRKAFKRYSSSAYDQPERQPPPPPPPPSQQPHPYPQPPSAPAARRVSAPASAPATDIQLKQKRERESSNGKGPIVREKEEIQVLSDSRQSSNETTPRTSRESDSNLDEKQSGGDDGDCDGGSRSANDGNSKPNLTSFAFEAERQATGGEIEKILSQQTMSSTTSDPISPTTTVIDTSAAFRPPDIRISLPDPQRSSGETGTGEIKGSPTTGDQNKDGDKGNDNDENKEHGEESSETDNNDDDDDEDNEDDESTPRASREIPSGRSSSVTFDTDVTEAVLHTKKSGPTSFAKRRSAPSPPPPSAYSRGVSFDTFDNRDATDYSLTLNYKHKDYKHSRRSRTFLCGTDANDYSDVALEWLIDELVDDGDEVVCLRVVEKDSKIASDQSIDSKRYHEEGRKFFESVVRKMADTKAISLVMELAVGKVQDLIQRMIQIYEPASLIVGTRGRSLGGVQGLLPGSISKYCLQQSPVPVIVVRPSNKREKKKQKRRADPTREHYGDVLRISDAVSGKIFDNGGKLEEEAAAVAQAIGLPSSVSDLPMRSSRTSLANKVSTGSLKSSDDVRVMESPSGSFDDLGDEEKSAGKEKAMASGALSPSPRSTTISFQDEKEKEKEKKEEESAPSVVISPSAPTSASPAEPSEEHVKVSVDSSATHSAEGSGSSPETSATSSSSTEEGTVASDKTLTAGDGAATTTTATPTDAPKGDSTKTSNPALADESAIQSSSSSSSSSSSAAPAPAPAADDTSNENSSAPAKTSDS